jgi:hypothetical protein
LWVHPTTCETETDRENCLEKPSNSGVGPGEAEVASNGKKFSLFNITKIANGALIPEVFHPLKIRFLSCFQ